MKKVKVPSSTIQSLETIFDNLADAVGNNITKREERTYKNLGFIFNMENDVPSSDDWKIELTPGPLDSGKFRINVGSLGTAKGILPNGELIGISTTKDITLSDLQLSSYYLIYAVWDSVGTEPVTRADGFLYDASGSANVENTIYLDRTTISSTRYTSLASAQVAADTLGYNTLTDRLPLAILKTASSGPGVPWDNTAWATGVTAEIGVLDLRVEARQLQLNENLLDDSTIIFKDRDSTALSGGGIDGDIDFLQTVNVTGAITGNSSLAISGQGNQVQITPSTVTGSVADGLTITNTAGDVFIKDNIRVHDSYVGIGMSTNPLYTLDVTGTFNLTGNGLITRDFTIANLFYADNSDRQVSIGSTTLSTGSKIHLDGSTEIGGALNVDDFMYVDATNDRVGLGTASPEEQLHLTGNMKFEAALIGTPAEYPGVKWANASDVISKITSTGTTITNTINTVDILSLSSSLVQTSQNLKFSADNKSLLSYGGYQMISSVTDSEGDVNFYIGDSTISDTSHINLRANTLGVNIAKSAMTADMEFEVNGDIKSDNLFIDSAGTIDFESSISINPTLASPRTRGDRLVTGLNLGYAGQDIDTDRLSPGIKSLGIELDATTISGSAINFYVTEDGTEDFSKSRDIRLKLEDDNVTIGSKITLSDNQFINSNSYSYLTRLASSHIAISETLTTPTAYISDLNLSRDSSISTSGCVFVNWDPSTDSVPSGQLNINTTYNKPAIIFNNNDYYNTDILFKHSDSTKWIMRHDNTSNLKLLYVNETGNLRESVTFNQNTIYASSIVSDSLTVSGVSIGDFVFPDVVVDSLTEAGGAVEITSSGLYASKANFGSSTLAVDGGLRTVTIGNAGGSSSLNVNGNSTFNDGFELINSGTNITIPGVSNTDFRIGVGTYGSDLEGLSVYAYDAAALTTPVKARIYDVNPRMEAGHFNVPFTTRFYWNFWGTTRIEVEGEYKVRFNIDDISASTLNAAELAHMIGKKLRGNNAGTPWGSYSILGVSVDGDDFILTLDSSWVAASIGTALIYDNCDDYVCTLYEFAPGEDTSNNDNATQSVTTVPAGNCFLSKLVYPEHTYKFEVKSRTGMDLSEAVALQAGTYDPDHAVGGQAEVTYTVPWEASLPYLTDDDASLTATTTPYGFTLNAGTSWKTSADRTKVAHFYHFCYTTASTLNFDDLSSTHNHRIQKSPSLDISTSESNDYQVGVRPYQNGMPVGSGITTSIMSGAGGNLPPGQVIADTDLNLVCTSGTSTVWADSVDCLHVEHTDVVAGEDSYLPSRFLDGQILTTAVSGSDSDFMITTDMQFAGSTRYLVLAPENAGDDPDVPSTWDTGITKRGRRLLKKRLAADYEINSITVNVGQLDTNDDSIVLETNPLVIRIYQEGFESSADSITITSPFTDVTQTVNVRILSRKEPSRTLIIDAYDTGDTPNNVTGITGHISVNALVLTDYIPEEAAPPIN